MKKGRLTVSECARGRKVKEEEEDVLYGNSGCSSSRSAQAAREGAIFSPMLQTGYLGCLSSSLIDI